MVDTTRTRRVLRSNQAAPSGRPRLLVTRTNSGLAVGRDPGATPSSDIWPDGRPNLLARVARAARIAVKEVSRAGDVPLPHLYRGRDFERRRDAA
jgi:hypothetical protein